ncbi:MAG: stage sporulation protein [Bacillales bacterium]|jgi:stage V sporulation protein AF|nr:stage sporulation protein [Bacillales bacterium]
MKLTKNLDENIQILKEHFGIGKSFDVIGKEIRMGNGDRKAYLLMLDGFTKDQMMYYITNRLQLLDFTDGTIRDLIHRHIAYMEADEFTEFERMEAMVLSGAIALFVDGFDSGVIIDTREYPIRPSAEPDLERVTRGPRDGFVETIIFNTALIRRRVKDPKLRFELKSVGKRSKTNITLAYIEDLVDRDYINEIKLKIDEIDVDALTMAEKSLIELMIKRPFYNPLPQVRFTERPDVAAAHLLEGHMLIIVDTTPSVIILPTTIFHFTQHAEDYYQSPIVGNYIRGIRYLVMFLSLFLAPLFLLAIRYHTVLPESLQFLYPKNLGEVPLIVQFILLELGIDVLRISSIHTPSSLTTSLGIIGGLILGEHGVKVGWFIPETILYMAVVGIGTFATPSIEFAMGIRIFRLYLLLLTGLFGFIGFMIGIGLILFIIFTTKNSTRRSYMWPLVPFDWKALKHILFRAPTPMTRRKN